MKYSDLKGQSVSRITLGTAQLARTYGISHSGVVLTRDDAYALLESAVAQGVNSIDTSNDYGEADIVIGEWLARRETAEQRQARDLLLGTKLVRVDFSSPEATRRSLREMALDCRRRLDIDTIPLLMLHSFPDYAGDPVTVMDTLKSLRAEGVCDRIGISIYENDDYDMVAQSEFDVVQIPLNILSWRRINDGSIARLAESGIGIFVRSVFLQGLFFLNRETMPELMHYALPYVEKFHGFCRKWDLSPAALAVSFVLSIPGITSLVMGCENETQLTENVRLVNSSVTLDSEQMAELRRAFADVPLEITSPSLWPKP
ncbi:MAG: aldo/keto reductase [Clostridiaceae bacterium]|nr:aldo/keto reductase [Clostridiaceae bacterium]